MNRSLTLPALLTASALLAIHATAPAADVTPPSPSQIGAPPVTIDYHKDETPEQKNERMKWWREARFGMFIHWGIYSVPAGIYKGKKIQHIGEWIMNDAKIPVAEYAEYAKQFNPTKFDANKFVEIAQNAGMKYMVITTKHHDGFAMFHSHVSPYNIYDATPFHRDPIAELAQAAKAHGMKLGFYYSQAQDWHHPGGAAAHGGHWDPAQDGSFDQYFHTIAIPQVKEILSNYGPVAELWFDTPMDVTPQEAADMVDVVTKLQPNIIMNNRLVRIGGEQPVGDFSTPEQYIPATGIPGKDWETCMTMNNTWGYKSWDDNWKSSETLIHNLIDASSKGGNYLLNVGPTAEGEIPEPSVERLAAIGKWMKTNGDAIYATKASPFRLQSWGRCTTKYLPGGATLYLSIFNWPKDGKLVVPVSNKVTSVHLLADPSRTFTTTANPDEGTVVNLTGDAPDPIASVVVMQIEGKPDVVAHYVKPADGGETTLTPQDANVQGARFNDISNLGKTPANLSNWNRNAAATWDVKLPTGTYDVAVNYSASADANLQFAISDDTTALNLKSTGAEAKEPKFETRKFGQISVTKDGAQTVTLHAETSYSKSNLEIHEITLTPAK
ncbi:MAG: alpha-L-fucosidase [Phycisphaerae bacterium]